MTISMYLYLFLHLAVLMMSISSIGRYILCSIKPNSEQYVASIISRDGKNAKLLWYPHNNYAPGESPLAAQFSRPALDCTSSVDYPFMNSLPKYSVSYKLLSDFY